MMSFEEWLAQKESSSHTRARRAAALGLMPPQVVGSLHGRSTAHPFEVEKLSGGYKSKKKKKEEAIDEAFRSTKNRKKVSHLNLNTGIDAWVKEVEDLKSYIEKLKKTIEDKKKEKEKSSTKDGTEDKKEEIKENPEELKEKSKSYGKKEPKKVDK